MLSLMENQMQARAKTTVKTSEAKRENSTFQPQKLAFPHPISTSTPIDHILYLQRTIGNQAVQRLFKSV